MRRLEDDFKLNDDTNQPADNSVDSDLTDSQTNPQQDPTPPYVEESNYHTPREDIVLSNIMGEHENANTEDNIRPEINEEQNYRETEDSQSNNEIAEPANIATDNASPEKMQSETELVQDQPEITEQEVEEEIGLDVDYDVISNKDGLTMLLLIIIFGNFGVHRFYAGTRQAIGALMFLFFGLPQILIITLGLNTSTLFLPPMVTQTSLVHSVERYSWLTSYWEYAKFVALLALMIEIILLLKGKYRDEIEEPIKIKATEEIFAYLSVVLILMTALLSIVGTRESARHEDPILKKINNATRYSN